MRDAGGSFLDQLFNNVVLSLATPHDYTIDPLLDTPDSRYQAAIANVAQQQLGSPLAQNGVYNPNSSGAVWGTVAGDALPVVATFYGGTRAIMGDAPLVGNPSTTSPAQSQTTVVIGEDMQNRVIPLAEQNGFTYYQPGPSLGSRAANLAANQTWLQTMINQGSTIIDIGPAPGRSYLSPFYQMESQMVNENSVPVISFYGFAAKQ